MEPRPLFSPPDSLLLDFYLGPWRIQPAPFKIIGPDETVVSVEPKVMQVLLCLARHQGDVVSRDRLMETVWPDVIIVDDTLTRCISQLRKIFGETPAEPCFIETIRKHGYRLLIPVQPVAGQTRLAGASGRPLRVRTGHYRASWVAVLVVLALVVYGLGWYSGTRQLRPTFVQAEAAQLGNTFVFFDSLEAQDLPAKDPNTFSLDGAPVSREEATLLLSKRGEDTAFVWHSDERAASD